MLTDRQNKTAEYIGKVVNRKTREANERAWNNNIQKNKEYFIKGNPLPKGLVAYLIGAGPSLEKNVAELKNVGSRGTIVCIDANLNYLIQNGVMPEYCASLDASDKMWTMIKPVIKYTKNITLVVNTASNPKVVRNWLGPIFFFSSIHPRFPTKSEEYFAKSRYAIAKRNIKKGTELFANKNYKIIFPGVLLELPCGGNVTTTAHAFCMQCLKATTIVMVGMDFSWKSDSNFYAGKEHQKNIKARVCNEQLLSHLDINKKRIRTNFSMHSFKSWHEQVSLQHPYSVINATEGGILGIDDKGNKEPFMGFATLKEVIKDYSPSHDKIKRDIKFPKPKREKQVVENLTNEEMQVRELQEQVRQEEREGIKVGGTD